MTKSKNKNNTISPPQTTIVGIPECLSIVSLHSINEILDIIYYDVTIHLVKYVFTCQNFLNGPCGISKSKV